MEAPHETQSIHAKLQETGEKERCAHLANVSGAELEVKPERSHRDESWGVRGAG